MDNTGQAHGFEVARIDEINSRYRCIFCLFIINNPIQLTECGHRSCLFCFESRADQSIDGNVMCPVDDCKEITNKSDIMSDRAFRRELDVLPIACKYQLDRDCSWTGHLKDYQKHLDENHVHHICQACRDIFSTKTALDEHMKRCPNIYKQCFFGKLCTEDMILKEEFPAHLLSEKHQETLTKLLRGEYNISESIVNTEIDDHFENDTLMKLSTLSHQVQELENKIVENHRTYENLSKGTTAVTDDLRSIFLNKNEKNPMKHLSQTTQNQIQKEIEQLDELVTNSQYIPMDGSLTWRIDNVAEKMADAQAERQTSIYSPIFYSSSTGYKMRARLFLFGDGNARRTHISLFFLLMKGEYDSILKWPFHYKVIFCLLDQTGNNRHIIDSFYPDVKSNSFQRPRENQNTASGIPKFFPLPMLLQDDNSYVRENTMYLKIMIALNETPKSVLPFMLTLNPALPNYVQENLINQEIARQQANATSN